MIQERAGILEFDAGFSRERAIELAKEMVGRYLQENKIKVKS